MLIERPDISNPGLGDFESSAGRMYEVFRHRNAFVMQIELIKSLQEIIKYYKYRGINWITRVGRPIVFPERKAIVFNNFYSNEGFSCEGVCQELTHQAFNDIIKYHPELYKELRIYRVSGGDPAFFSTPPFSIVDRYGNIIRTSPRAVRGQHIFLAITDKQILKRGDWQTGHQVTESLLDANAYIFDPSFGVFQPFSESGYIVENIWAPGFKVSVKTGAEVFIDAEFSSPNAIIGMTNGILIGLNAYLNAKSDSVSLVNIEIRIITPMTRSPIVFPIFDKELVYLVKYLKDLDILIAHSQREWKFPISGGEYSKYDKMIEYG
ncbi:MAG: hypothetical protein BWY26_00618 [Elusimicrobia bacterium ADurb.Bin231]|nr:MAG: hypothetical protein BWY26_00618 [Elusimicrobia bacterium ADurb.Bin231]